MVREIGKSLIIAAGEEFFAASGRNLQYEPEIINKKRYA